MAKLKATDFQSVRWLLGNRDKVKIGNNTEAIQNDNDGFDIRLHGNLIVRLNKSSVVIYDGGHRSSTTKERINQFLPPGWRLFQEDWHWYILDTVDDCRWPFVNGFIIPTVESSPKMKMVIERINSLNIQQR